LFISFYENLKKSPKSFVLLIYSETNKNSEKLKVCRSASKIITLIFVEDLGKRFVRLKKEPKKIILKSLAKLYSWLSATVRTKFQTATNQKTLVELVSGCYPAYVIINESPSLLLKINKSISINMFIM